MELMYPIAIVICLILTVAIYFVKLNKKNVYKDGKKVANTSYIKQTDYYKEKLKKYKLLTTIMKILLAISIIVSSVLIARPVTIQTINNEQYNRDILLGLDVSGSQDEVNYELIKKFKAIIPNIKGDRIGIVIFNTCPLTYCPLTEDYDYVIECLNNLEKALKQELDKSSLGLSYDFTNSDDELSSIFYGGVVAGSDTRGSSLIGDGLAGTMYAFPDIKDKSDRTRIIIFATDNDLAGKETVTLSEACELCRKYKVNVYAHCPTTEMNPYATTKKIAEYKNSVENKAKGKFFTGDLQKSLSKIVDEIKTTKTSLLKGNKKTLVTDHPEIAVIVTVILFVIIIILEKFLK